MAKSCQAAYQGEKGAYSEEAIIQYFGSEVSTCGFETCGEVLDAVQNDRAKLGFLPAENSIAGTITQTYDLLLESKLTIVGEYYFRIHHNLLALPGVTIAEIDRVYSHPQALAQCQQFLKKYSLKPMPEWDTAGGARKLRRENLPTAAAIASQRAAKIHNLQVLFESIEDVSHNTTRFFILGKNESLRTKKSKTSILFSVRDNPGELLRCLEVFATHGLNLTKIESRPERNRPWHYIFYLDFEGHVEDAPVEQALVQLLKRASFVKVLGSYPEGIMPEWQKTQSE